LWYNIKNITVADRFFTVIRVLNLVYGVYIEYGLEKGDIVKHEEIPRDLLMNAKTNYNLRTTAKCICHKVF